MTITTHSRLTAVLVAGLLSLSVSSAVAAEIVPLKDVFPFKVGTAVPVGLFANPTPEQERLIAGTFSALTPENELKPSLIQPREGEFHFDAADKYVAFGEKHKMKIIGHCLVWHEQTGGWMFEGLDGKPASRDLLIARMRRHIHTVVGRYKGRIHGWDVVNEAIEWDGSYRRSKWCEIIGEDFIDLAFQFAHEADPNAELYYNDFNMDQPGKRAGVVRLVRRLKRKGLRIDAVGMQSHVSLGGPSLAEYEKSIVAFADCGVKVCATELDISVLPNAWGLTADIRATHDYEEKFDPYRKGLPREKQEELAKRYCDFFTLYLRHADVMDRVTVWGVFDKNSWLNGFPVPGRTDYPLFYDRDEKPKPCAKALYKLGREKSVKVRPRAPVDRTATFLSFGYRGDDVLPPCNAKTEYRNPIIAGMGPDPSITRKGDDYYLAQSNFSYYPGVPIWHSTNLVDWDFVGYCMDRTSQVNLFSGISLNDGVYAPDIKYNPYNDTFYLIVTVVADACRIFKTKDPRLGWSPAIKVSVPGIDPAIYFESDKVAYIVNNQDPATSAEYGGHKAIWLRQYDLVTDTLVAGSAKQLTHKGIHPEKKPIWCEGPHLYKINGRYYLMTAEGGTGYMHSEVAWVADRVDGPYTPCTGQNPILTQRTLDFNRRYPVTCAGHADLVYTDAGDPTTAKGFSKDGWFAVFLAMQPYTKTGDWHQFCNTGRMTHLVPVKWEGSGNDLTPVIQKDGTPVPLVAKRTGVMTRAAVSGARQTAGNVVYHDKFVSPKLDPLWIQLRNPDDEWFYVRPDRPGLQVKLRTDSLYSRGNPSYVCRWLKNDDFTVATTLQFTPENAGEIAGLALYQNEGWNYVLAKTGDGAGGANLVLRRCEGGRKKQVAVVAVDPKRPVALRCVGRGSVLEFAYRVAGEKNWTPIGGQQDGTVLSTERAGGFVGASVGLYACAREGGFPLTANYTGLNKVSGKLALAAGAELDALEIVSGGFILLDGAELGKPALTVGRITVPEGVALTDRVIINAGGRRSRTTVERKDGRFVFTAVAADERTPVRTVWINGGWSSFMNGEGFFNHWMQGKPNENDTLVFIENSDVKVWDVRAYSFAAVELLGDAAVIWGPDQTWKYPSLRVRELKGKGTFTLYRAGLKAQEDADLTVGKEVSLVIDNDGKDSWIEGAGSHRAVVNGAVSVKNLLIVRNSVVFNGEVSVEKSGTIREESPAVYNGKVKRQ